MRKLFKRAYTAKKVAGLHITMIFSRVIKENGFKKCAELESDMVSTQKK